MKDIIFQSRKLPKPVIAGNRVASRREVDVYVLRGRWRCHPRQRLRSSAAGARNHHISHGRIQRLHHRHVASAPASQTTALWKKAPRQFMLSSLDSVVVQPSHWVWTIPAVGRASIGFCGFPTGWPIFRTVLSTTSPAPVRSSAIQDGFPGSISWGFGCGWRVWAQCDGLPSTAHRFRIVSNRLRISVSRAYPKNLWHIWGRSGVPPHDYYGMDGGRMCRLCQRPRAPSISNLLSRLVAEMTGPVFRMCIWLSGLISQKMKSLGKRLYLWNMTS